MVRFLSFLVVCCAAPPGVCSPAGSGEVSLVLLGLSVIVSVSLRVSVRLWSPPDSLNRYPQQMASTGSLNG